MKTTILFLFLAIAGLTCKAQTTFEAESLELADSVQLLKDMTYRPIIIADSNGFYWITLGDYALQFDKAYIQVWNDSLDKTDIWLKEMEPIEAKVEVKEKVREKLVIDKKDFKKTK
jgi:hypothetical protein